MNPGYSRSSTSTPAATSPARQSMKKTEVMATRKPLPPRKPYHTGKQCPVTENRQVKAIPVCLPYPQAAKAHPNTRHGRTALSMSQAKTAQAYLPPYTLLKLVNPGFPLPLVLISS